MIGWNSGSAAKVGAPHRGVGALSFGHRASGSVLRSLGVCRSRRRAAVLLDFAFAGPGTACAAAAGSGRPDHPAAAGARASWRAATDVGAADVRDDGRRRSGPNAKRACRGRRRRQALNVGPAIGRRSITGLHLAVREEVHRFDGFIIHAFKIVSMHFASMQHCKCCNARKAPFPRRSCVEAAAGAGLPLEHHLGLDCGRKGGIGMDVVVARTCLSARPSRSGCR